MKETFLRRHACLIQSPANVTSSVRLVLTVLCSFTSDYKPGHPRCEVCVGLEGLAPPLPVYLPLHFSCGWRNESAAGQILSDKLRDHVVCTQFLLINRPVDAFNQVLRMQFIKALTHSGGRNKSKWATFTPYRVLRNVIWYFQHLLKMYFHSVLLLTEGVFFFIIIINLSAPLS